ncbi:hypothetical protein EVAR_102262_1 [Eumeta japonica]|uniref:Uncharacterized protein n=1 Tax=Eumeta variegata TaxID=151549 RepID=A0A4C1ZL67_EUMVA|nr:hypothetical protein EVAR_102262_1 [Eumeta japonica]
MFTEHIDLSSNRAGPAQGDTMDAANVGYSYYLPSGGWNYKIRNTLSQFSDLFSEFNKYIAPAYHHDRCERYVLTQGLFELVISTAIRFAVFIRPPQPPFYEIMAENTEQFAGKLRWTQTRHVAKGRIQPSSRGKRKFSQDRLYFYYNSKTKTSLQGSRLRDFHSESALRFIICVQAYRF